jgi:hypothetical protein
MAKKIVIILTTLIILTFFVGCNSKTRASSNDIEAAKKVLQNHFEALNKESLDDINKTLGQYQSGRFNKDNLSKWKPEVVSISYPGKLTNDNIPPKSYKSNYGKVPYKSINFYVVYKENGEQQEMDYILVKEDKEGPWLIHDWGQ